MSRNTTEITISTLKKRRSKILTMMRSGITDLNRRDLETVDKAITYLEDTMDKKDHVTLAGRCLRADDREGALRHSMRALALDPGDAGMHNDVGRLLCMLGHYEASIPHSTIAAETAKTDPEFWSNLGNHLWMAGRAKDAEAALGRCLELDPDHPHGTHHLGLFLYGEGRTTEAIRVMQRAVELRRVKQADGTMADNSDAIWDLSITLLMAGRYEEGYRLYEVRYDRPPLNMDVRVPRPDWDGIESLDGKHIAIGHEQGFGDTIQFARFVPVLKEKTKAGVTFIVQPSLVGLMRSCLKDYCDVVTLGAKFPMPDVKLSLLSLPLKLGMTSVSKPLSFPYLVEPPGSPSVPTHPGIRLKVGICWAGSTEHVFDHLRSTDLGPMLRLAEIPGVQLYSFQKGSRVAEIEEAGAGHLVYDLGSGLHDFADSAGAMRQMDVMVSVDTAMLHLAGAMAIPCIGLIRTRNPDWRWGVKGDKSRWYPSMRIVRNTDGWIEAIEKAKDLIRGLTSPVEVETFMEKTR